MKVEASRTTRRRLLRGAPEAVEASTGPIAFTRSNGAARSPDRPQPKTDEPIRTRTAEAMIRRGYSDAAIEAALGGHFRRPPGAHRG